ncbi:MAG: ribonuclease HIII [Lentimonas sp.]|jgi:ribonuclease HIII
MPKKKTQQIEDEGPKAKTIYTIKLDEAQLEQLGERLDNDPSDIWEFYDVAYSQFAYKGDGINVVAYQSGKVVVQGKKTEEFVRDILEAEITGEARLGYEDVHNPEWFTLHAGCDESGKGDLFGPLVTACVIADEKMVRDWIEAGVCDSKKITDRTIIKLDKVIRKTKGVVIATGFARMTKYNHLYRKSGGNLNKLLAWYHGRCLNEALDKRPAPWGLLDQFTKEKLVDAYVIDRKDFKLVSRTKAESDPVVAAASIIARAIYVREMKLLSDELEDVLGEKLQKGAGAKVLEQAKKIVAVKGSGELSGYAKMHFKTAYEAQGLEPPKKPAWSKY